VQTLKRERRVFRRVFQHGGLLSPDFEYTVDVRPFVLPHTRAPTPQSQAVEGDELERSGERPTRPASTLTPPPFLLLLTA
jgi:hypothetical protein